VDLLPLDQWRHLAVTFDGTVFNFYVDGVLKGGPSFGTFSSPPTDAPLLIGGSGGCPTFIGLMDEVAFFNYALGEEEVQAIYDGGDLAHLLSMHLGEDGEPYEVSLAAGESMQLIADVRDRDGNRVSDPLIAWQLATDVGTLNDDGIFTAGTKAGTFSSAILVNVVHEGERASAVVEITVQPGPFAKIEIEQSDVVVQQGDTVAFTANATDEFGNVIPDLALTFLWEATGGSITQNGLHTAGDNGRSYDVKGTAVFGERTVNSVASVSVGAAAVVVSPTMARDIGEYTIQVFANQSLAVGQNIFVKFDGGVPSTISVNNVTLKASVLTGGGVALQVVNPTQITVDGDEVKLTVPDMDPSTASGSLGQQGIGAGRIVIVFSQAAGIQNPNTAADYTLDVWTTTETTHITSAPFAITSELVNSSNSKARGAVIVVTGVGMNADAATVPIYLIDAASLALAQAIATDTSLSTVEEVGTGSIDSNGVFTGTWTSSSDTSAGGFIRIVDSGATPEAYHVTTRFTQKAGATSQDLTVEPGADLKVDLVDYTGGAVMSTSTSAKIGTTTQTSAALTLPSDGDTTAATPYEFTVNERTLLGTHTVTITDGTKSATFRLEVIGSQ